MQWFTLKANISEINKNNAYFDFIIIIKINM